MCVDGFYATVNSISWIKHQEYIEKNELTELIKAVRKQNKNSSFKIEFVMMMEANINNICWIFTG